MYHIVICRLFTALALLLSVNLLSSAQPTQTTNPSLDRWPAAVREVLTLPPPNRPFRYHTPRALPSHFNTPFTRDQVQGSIDHRLASVGRVLFYDKALSANDTVSCASCHQQAHAFSDPATQSVGLHGELTQRNSMPLINLRYYQRNRFFWDERANSLEEQALIPIQDPIEMGMTLETLTTKLEETAYYPVLFHWAFGDGEITSSRLADALAHFMRAIVSYRSRYDIGMAETGTTALEDFAEFTEAENRGKTLFFSARTHCSLCHGSNGTPAIGTRAPQALYLAQTPLSNGLDTLPEQYNEQFDYGIGGKSGLTQDLGLFKAPSLRNIELTNPYMHDGRFASLEEVVEHYNSGIQDHPQLPVFLRNPDSSPQRLGLTIEEKADLIAFLKTLTDHALLTDRRYSDPFK